MGWPQSIGSECPGSLRLRCMTIRAIKGLQTSASLHHFGSLLLYSRRPTPSHQDYATSSQRHLQDMVALHGTIMTEGQRLSPQHELAALASSHAFHTPQPPKDVEFACPPLSIPHVAASGSDEADGAASDDHLLAQLQVCCLC